MSPPRTSGFEPICRCALLTALLLTACVSFEVKEDHFFLPGPARTTASIAVEGAIVEPLELHTVDGERLVGVYIRKPHATVDIIYFGGNNFRLDDGGSALARTLSSLPANVICFDHRGYGRSTGTPTISSLKSDALAIFDSAAMRGSGLPLVLHGFSLGGFMASYVAAHRPVAGLILESTAPDVRRWARHQIPFYAKPLVRLRIAPALLEESNEQRLRSYKGPMLLLTGSADPVTPPQFAAALSGVPPSARRQTVIVPEATHGNVMIFPMALRAYRDFLSSITASGPQMTPH